MDHLSAGDCNQASSTSHIREARPERCWRLAGELHKYPFAYTEHVSCLRVAYAKGECYCRWRQQFRKARAHTEWCFLCSLSHALLKTPALSGEPSTCTFPLLNRCQTSERIPDHGSLLDELHSRLRGMAGFDAACSRSCWFVGAFIGHPQGNGTSQTQ